MKKNIISLVSLILFAAAVALGLKYITTLFADKNTYPFQYNFAKVQKDSIDVVFIGNSHQFCSIDTLLLKEEYGIESYMLASSMQTIPMSYYAVMEAIELQHPDKIVLELFYLANDVKSVNDVMNHAFFDGMPDCRAQELALSDIVEDAGDRIYYRWNLGAYHVRWKTLGEDDFKGIKDMPYGCYYNDTVTANTEIVPIDQSETAEAPALTLEYLDKIIDLCSEEGVELICYISPFNVETPGDEASENTFVSWQKVYNWASGYLAGRGVAFHNLMYELDGLGLDMEKDFLDRQHVNCYGQEKLTRYMADMGYLD